MQNTECFFLGRLSLYLRSEKAVGVLCTFQANKIIFMLRLKNYGYHKNYNVYYMLIHHQFHFMKQAEMLPFLMVECLVFVSVGQMRNCIRYCSGVVIFCSVHKSWLSCLNLFVCVHLRKELLEKTLKCYSLHERHSMFSSVGVMLYSSDTSSNTSE